MHVFNNGLDTPIIVFDQASLTSAGKSVLFDLFPVIKKSGYFNDALDAKPISYLVNDYSISDPLLVDGVQAMAGVITDSATGMQVELVRNTRVTLKPIDFIDIFKTPKVSVLFKKLTVIYYDRIHVGDLPVLRAAKGKSTTVYQLLAKINAATGFLFTSDDLDNAPLPDADANGMVTIVPSIKVTSLKYYTGTKIFSGSRPYFGTANIDPADVGTGEGGTTATIQVGSVQTVDAGLNAEVTNAGTSSAAVFNFKIPRGPGGLQGNDGKSAYQLAVENGFIGNLAAYLVSLKGNDGVAGKDGVIGLDGKDGANGKDGVNGTNGTNGLDGRNGSDGLNGQNGRDGLDGVKGADGKDGTNGTDGQSGLNGQDGADGLVGPAGIDGTNGDNGLSAFELAVASGYDGSLATWLLSLKGDGGSDGRSAYQIAVLNGFTGTESEWLLSLKEGSAGINGTDGKDGIDGAAGRDGADGVNGTNGLNGTDGQSAYQAAVVAGYVGTPSQWVFSLKGNDGVNGTDGIDGKDGANGVDGVAGTNGLNGVAGANGLSAYQVAVLSGFVGTEVQWLASLKGTDGAAGTDGVAGKDGINGTNGSDGAPGADGQAGQDGQTGQNGTDGKSAYQLAVINGYVGTETDWLLSLKGAAGSGGGSSIIYNSVCRYFAESTAGQTVQVVTSSTFFTNLSWARFGTALTVGRAGHGRSVGDRVILRNTSVDLLVALITAVTTDSFTVNCADAGPVTGAEGAYTCGVNFTHNGATGAITSGNVIAPANTDLQLMSMRVHLKANTRAATNYVLTVPPALISSLGGSTSADNSYIPVQMVRQDADALAAVGNTLSMNYGSTGNYAAFQFGALPNIAIGMIMAITF